ncbi:hypothetical protein TeGR_g710 [Tetraparma gracilis]|uniref:Calmodulin n=1 Tax=Tetraparma gracilis TaxID=2962635 RepID=A0ABQ6MXX1_9STRA|nr:hypothetical protein TeGR_g710 [Tetraparma gracilis]
MFDRIIAKTQSADGHFSEAHAAEIIQAIIEAIAYCHDEKHICHRDLKPENFLFETKEEHSRIKIIDFGLSRHEDGASGQGGGMMKTKVGTPYYVAPEVLKKEYDKSCDMWSIGVISYILLCGYPPFYGDNDQQIFESVKSAKYDYPSPEWDDISDKAKSFIDALLKKDPSKRLTAQECLSHTWFTDLGLVDKTSMPSLKHNNALNSKFKAFLGMNKLKKAALAHIAETLTSEEVHGMREVFQKIDVDGDGTLTIDELQHALSTGGFSKDVNTEISTMIETLEVEGDHVLNWQEFCTATVDQSVLFQEDKIRMAFNYFDRSHRGSISRADLANVFGSQQQATEIMGQIDANGDGAISYEEFHQMIDGKTGGSGKLGSA